MKNPWTKKNPFLSMWLSGANAVGGAARSQATAQARRETTRLINSNAKVAADFWTQAIFPSAAKPRKKRRK
jgi:hypothetical protein